MGSSRNERIFVIVDQMVVFDDESPAVVGLRRGEVTDETVVVGSEGSSMHERKMREVEEVVDRLSGGGVDVDRWHPDLLEGRIVPFRDPQDVRDRFVQCDPDEAVLLSNPRRIESSLGKCCVGSEGGDVGTSTIGAESPSVVRTFDRRSDNPAIGESSEAMRTHIAKDANLAIECDDGECFAKELDPLRFVAERFDAPDRMPESAKLG
jgi:hypothetical protein